MNSRRFIVLAGVATALSGCGGSSGLSAHELAQRANAICTRYAPSYVGGDIAATREDVVRYLDRTNPIAAHEERELRALRPRRDEAVRVRRLLDHVHAANRILTQLRSAEVAHDDRTAIKSVRALGVMTRATTKEARALGWTACARDPRQRP